MPTNLTAEAKVWLARYQEAKSIEDKITALETALSHIPKHKHTEKLQRQVKKRLAQLRRESVQRKSSKVGRQQTFSVVREGAAQVVILGAANSGKSSLLAILTGARPVIADYPLTTVRPIPGMMKYSDVEIQLVELPAIMTENCEETQFLSRSLGLAKNADAVMIILDGSAADRQLAKLVDLMEEGGLTLRRRTGEVRIEHADAGGVRIVNLGRLKATTADITKLLGDFGVKHAVVKITGDVDLNDIEEALMQEMTFKPSLVVLNKKDKAGPETLSRFRNLLKEMELSHEEISVKTHDGLQTLANKIFVSLNIMRVFTQKDGVKSARPIVVPRETKVAEIAKTIHKDIARKLRYARVWGSSVKIPGQQVGPNHILSDMDLIELYTD